MGAPFCEPGGDRGTKQSSCGALTAGSAHREYASLRGMAVRARQTGNDDPLEFDVEVRETGSRTQHRVTASRATVDRLAGGRSPEGFIEAAFAFLLEREPKESILRSFDVAVIGRYFPEFEREIGRYLP
jgi:hypothetical protein